MTRYRLVRRRKEPCRPAQPSAAAGSRCLAWFLIAPSLLVGFPALALDPTEQLSELSHTQWTARDGSQPIIGAVRSVSAIADDIWIGMQLGGAFRLHAGTLTHYGVAEGLPARSVLQVVARVAANEEGVWNDVGPSVPLLIRPAFYQTRLFYVLCSVSAILLLWQLYLLRIRQIRRQLKTRLNAQLDERERIARELHDTLLQSAQGLILFVQSLAARLERPDSMRQETEDALNRADELLSEARDRVSDLRTIGVEADLEKAVARFGAELFKDKPLSLTITSAGVPRVLALGVADDVYRICREALTNAFLHAKATLVTVEIDYDPAAFRLRITDDGRGIEAVIRESGAKPGHFGLQGMRERALRHGGTLTISSSEGTGTEVALSVPRAVAYPDESRVHGWLSRLWRTRARKTTRVNN